ncbi:MAG: hypothetical protein AB7O52_07340 [Planctomycetota bacterium]
MNGRANGFMLVRTPERNTDLLDSAGGPILVAERAYCGVDRMAWADLDEVHYGRRADEAVEAQWQRLRSLNRDLSGLRLLPGAREAWKVKSQLASIDPMLSSALEVISIWSPELVELKGELHCDAPISLIGYDAFALGEWSLVAAGLFGGQALHAEWASRLNEFGLLRDKDEVREFAAAYAKEARENRLEELQSEAKVVSVAVSRVEEPSTVSWG